MLLERRGTPRPGGQVDLDLTARTSAGLAYQLGSSLGTGSITVDTRRIDLGLDSLLVISENDLWPTVFVDYRGVIDTDGHAPASLSIPDLSPLVGTRIHTAFVTLNGLAPSWIRSISNAFSFSITP